MEDNRWDDHLRDLLDENTPGDTASSPIHIPLETDPATSGNVELQDKSWKRIEASLDAADHAFEESVRRKIGHYHPTYDQTSWPIFLQRFADHQFLRARLVMLKIIEVSALILFLITAVKFGFVTNLHQGDKQENTTPPSGSFTDNVNRNANASDQAIHQIQITEKSGGVNEEAPSGKTNKLVEAQNEIAADKNNTKQSTPRQSKTTYTAAIGASNSAQRELVDQNTHRNAANNKTEVDLTENTPSSSSVIDQTTTSTPSDINVTAHEAIDSRATSNIPAINIAALETDDATNAIGDITAPYYTYITDPITALDSDIDFENTITVPRPNYAKPKERKYTEFSILAQSDYNGLRMPEDRLFTYGQQIVFPQQGIMSHGFGGGFTIAIGHPRWAVETGVIYSAKDFQPGRQLIVGGVFDNGSIEFQAMRLQLVSVPIQYRYRFDHSGRMKFYGLAGGGFNMIVQSDIDVQVKYHFPSLSFGANPNADPNLAETIRETRRISEHIRDGAPFSTKNFVSINAGIGTEYQLTEYKTLFMQGTVLYQIPDLAFSNNNGKHLRSVSLQVGVRTPLGK